jgi:hypothetical protein
VCGNSEREPVTPSRRSRFSAQLHGCWRRGGANERAPQAGSASEANAHVLPFTLAPVKAARERGTRIMGRFTSAEAAEFGRIRALCYQDLGPKELLALVGGRLQRFLGADAFCANEVDAATLLLMSAASYGWPIEARA